LPLSIMRLYLPRTGRFDSVVANPKIEIIFFNGHCAIAIWAHESVTYVSGPDL
jgi:hypothetical protein